VSAGVTSEIIAKALGGRKAGGGWMARGSDRDGHEPSLPIAYTATVSWFGDGRLAELFLNNHKAGSQADTSARDAAITLSLALQHGADAETIRKALCRDSHLPSERAAWRSARSACG